MPAIHSISAVTLFTPDMTRAVRFYLDLGFDLAYGGERAGFTSFRLGVGGHLNLARTDERAGSPGATRVIFYVEDVDALYRRVLAQGLAPEAPPRDAEWGERYFHLADPDGHALSFAQPLDGPRPARA